MDIQNTKYIAGLMGVRDLRIVGEYSSQLSLVTSLTHNDFIHTKFIVKSYFDPDDN